MASERMYLCQIIGTGSDEDPIRPAVSGANVSVNVLYPPSGPDGRPKKNVCLVVAQSDNHLALASKGDPLPEYPLDANFASLATVAKSKLTADIRKHGLESRFAGKAFTSYRSYIREIGRAISEDENWDERSFGIPGLSEEMVG